MNRCINDPTRNFKGTEPSPKGLGYCAHAEEIGVVKRGKDGKLWKVNTTKKGIKRWIKNTDIKSCAYDKTKKDTKRYLIIDNGGVSFIVYINTKTRATEIYKSAYKSYEIDYNSYTILVKKYNPISYFVGEDKRISTPENRNNKSVNKYYCGNSILLRLKNLRYVFIGESIYEFDAPHEILKFFSPVGNSDVPYPYAISDYNIFFLIADVYMDLNTVLNNLKTYGEPYAIIYSLTKSETKKFTKPIIKTIIHNRL